MKQDETKALDREIGDYVAENTKVIWEIITQCKLLR